MNKSVPSIGRVLVISGFALSCFGLLTFLWLAFGGPIPLKPQGYRMQVAFDDAVTLAEQADVRTAGVSIGKVTSKELAPEGNRTLATLQIEEEFAPIRSDARAILRQKTLLGETYVELTTGSKDVPFIEEDGRLSNGQVAEAVEFDELLRIFDEDTRQSFRDWQETLAQATRGRGRDFNDALGNFPVFTENAQAVVDVLNRRREALGALVENTGSTFEAITRNGAALQTLIQRNTDTFETLADKRESLAETFQVFPTFLDESRLTLDRLRTFSADTQPLIEDLEPVLEDLQPTLASLGDLSPDLEKLFRDLRPLIEAGDEGFPALARILRGLDPTLASVGPFLEQLNPLLRFLEFQQVTVTDFISQAGAATAGKRAAPADSKSNGHVLGQHLILGSQSVPASERTDDNRGNAYLFPNYTADGEKLILPNFDCKHIGGPKPPTDTPGCFVQGPADIEGGQRFPGLEKFFPNVTEGGPAGTEPQAAP